MWKRPDHLNIVLFKDATFEPLRLASEWIDLGELREYLRANLDADLISLVSLFRRCLVFVSIQTSSHPAISRSALPIVTFTFTHAI